jgi:hypothetical protein
MRKLFIGLVAPVLAGAMLLACGGDDSDGSTPTNDGGLGDVVTTPGTDGSTTPRGDSGTTPPGDGGVACNFAAFVKGLVANDTTMTALPSTDLGQSCTDDHDAGEFHSLSP